MLRLLAAVLIFTAGWLLGWGMRVQPPVQLRDSVDLQPPPVLLDGPPAVAAAAPSAATPAALDELAASLQRQDVDAVMVLYARVQREADSAVLNAAHSQVLAHAHSLLEAQRFDDAEHVLQALLQQSYRDVEARVLLAAAYQGQDAWQSAIDQLYEARGYAYKPATLRGISNRIRSYVATLTRLLKQQDDASELLGLYQQLVQQEPDYAPYFIGLADAQLALDDLEAARRSLSLVAQDPAVGAQAQSSLAEINQALAERQDDGLQQSAAVVGVPLQRNGNHFIVSARPANTRSIQLLIDTGASLTVFSPAVFEQRGIRYADTGKTGVFNTANGAVQAPIYRLAALTIGDWQVNELDIGVMDLDGAGVDGLLGMNFLSHFQFFIDQNESELRLSIN